MYIKSRVPFIGEIISKTSGVKDNWRKLIAQQMQTPVNWL